jgi:hypothetical protein
MKKNAVFTVEGALSQWCPRAQVAVGPAGDVYSNMPNSNATTCAGPACMAWRWHTTHISNPQAPKGDLIESADTYGFCGLAGSP